MQRPKRITLSPTATDADGIAQSQTPAGGGVQNLTLNGVLVSGGVATFSTPQHVTITAVGVETARTFTVTGTDRFGNAMTEAITGPSATVVAGTKNFATVTSITVDDNTAGAVTAGVDGTCESKWIPLDTYGDYDTSLAGVISSGGGMTYTVQHTYDDVQASDFDENTANAFAASAVQGGAALAGATASAFGSYTAPIVATRVAITAHTSGSLEFQIVPGGSV